MTMLVAWWQFERVRWEYFTPTPAVIHGDIKILNKDKSVIAGQWMFYEVSLEKKLHGACIVKRQLVNSYTVSYDPSYPPEKPLGPQYVKGKLHIPRGTDPGQDWFMRLSLECPVGPYNKVVIINAVTERFQVIDAVDLRQGKQGMQGIQGKPGKDFWGK